MRLIDADKLKGTEGLFQYQINETFDRISASAYRFEDVENAPTIEAIPTEWIENYITMLTVGGHSDHENNSEQELAAEAEAIKKMLKSFVKK